LKHGKTNEEDSIQLFTDRRNTYPLFTGQRADREANRPTCPTKKIAQLDKSTRVDENDQQSTKQL